MQRWVDDEESEDMTNRLVRINQMSFSDHRRSVLRPLHMHVAAMRSITYVNRSSGPCISDLRLSPFSFPESGIVSLSEHARVHLTLDEARPCIEFLSSLDSAAIT